VISRESSDGTSGGQNGRAEVENFDGGEEEQEKTEKGSDTREKERKEESRRGNRARGRGGIGGGRVYKRELQR